MGCKKIFSPQAIADLEAAVEYFAGDNPDPAVRVGNALIDRISINTGFQPGETVPKSREPFQRLHGKSESR